MVGGVWKDGWDHFHSFLPVRSERTINYSEMSCPSYKNSFYQTHRRQPVLVKMQRKNSCYIFSVRMEINTATIRKGIIVLWKIKKEQFHAPAIILLGMYLNEMMCQRDISFHVYHTALLTVGQMMQTV